MYVGHRREAGLKHYQKQRRQDRLITAAVSTRTSLKTARAENYRAASAFTAGNYRRAKVDRFAALHPAERNTWRSPSLQ
jgi:hypothetical protein